MIQKLGFLIFTTFSFSALAFAPCGPASCSPPCDGSCDYATCVNKTYQTVSTSDIPFNYSSAPVPDVCSAPLDQKISILPFTLKSDSRQVTVSTIRSAFQVPIIVCEHFTASGGACPPASNPGNGGGGGGGGGGGKNSGAGGGAGVGGGSGGAGGGSP